MAAAPRSGAQRGQTPAATTRTVLGQHLDSAKDALRRLYTQPLNSLMNLMVIAIALLMPALLFVGGQNVAQFGHSLDETHRISFYLHTDISPTQIETLQHDLSEHPLVAGVNFISARQAAEDFAQWSGLGDVIASMDNNPLPPSLVVQASDTRVETAIAIRDAFASREGIRLVTLDQAWIERLNSLLNLVDRVVIALILVLSLAVLFIVGNAIRTQFAAREAEVRVMTLIGATRHFIARPFLYSGAWQGLFGAILAWLLLQALLLLLRAPAQTLLAYYGEQYHFIGLNGTGVAVLLMGGLLLGWAGAWLSVSRHLARFQ